MSVQRWNLSILAALVGGAIFIGATRLGGATALGPPPAAAADPAPLPGHPAPDFRLPTADGGTIALAELRGQVVLINIWATWCPPCRAEMPAIQAVYEQYREQGLVVLALNQGEDAAAVAAFLEREGLSLPAPLDADGQVSAAYRASVLPSSFFIDRRGVVRAVYRGPMSHGVIASTVAQLLAEEPGQAGPAGR